MSIFQSILLFFHKGAAKVFLTCWKPNAKFWMPLEFDNINVYLYYQPQLLIFLLSYLWIRPELCACIFKLILVNISFINWTDFGQLSLRLLAVMGHCFFNVFSVNYEAYFYCIPEVFKKWSIIEILWF